MVNVAVINESKSVSDKDVRAVVKALQVQVSKHFAPVWGIDAKLTFVPKGQKPASGSWWLVYFDDSDVAGALGYHDVTSEGLPLGKVFAGTVKKYGGSHSVTASHELLEMLGDPDINLTVFVESESTAGVLYAYEVADACEADQFGYKIGDILVSDFVYPSWFQSFWQSQQTQFDYMKKITKPFQLLSGGYIGVYDIGSGGGWTQKTYDTANSYDVRPRVGSRREKRRTPREHWLASTIRLKDTAQQVAEWMSDISKPL